MEDKKQKDRTCNNNCKDICGECQIMVFKKQTAVEWLVERWEKLQSRGEKGSWSQIIRITEQAKEIEKKQMKEIYLKGIKNYEPTFKKPMSNKKQTAVEWLKSIAYEKDLDLGHWNRAKAMEKEQIKSAYVFGLQDEYVIGSENYYKQTYRGDTIQNMKNITDLTIDQLEQSKLLIDQMTQVLFKRSIDIPMTREIHQIQDLLNNIYSDYADELDKKDGSFTY